MNYEISCEAFSRLAGVAAMNDTDDEDRAYLFSVYLERKAGNLVAVVTNAKIAAVEWLGSDDGPDGHVHVSIDPLIVEQCEKQKAFNADLLITDNPMLKYAAVKTTFGFSYVGNGALYPDDSMFPKWREWTMPDKMPKATKGAMFTYVDRLVALAKASPSGALSFPEFIDNEKPVIVRDVYEPTWFGAFIPWQSKDGVRKAHPAPANIPDWVSA